MSNKSQVTLRSIGWLETIIGAFGMLSSIWFIFIGVVYFFGKGLPNDDCGLGGLAVIHLFWALPLSVLFFLGIGVLKLRPWSRIAHTIIFSIILAVELFFLAGLIVHSNADFLWHIPGSVISGGIVWFFTRPAIKSQFKK